MTASRRSFLASLALPHLIRPSEEAGAFSDYDPAFRVDVQARNPRVKCFDLRRLTTVQTPASEFFTFHQKDAVEEVDLEQWRLEISGSVARPRTLTFSDLVRLPEKHVPAVIECSGNNGDSRLMNGLVSNGVWTGPALAPLLRDCGVLPEAREVVFFGSDLNRERKWPVSDREMEAPHGRSIFVQDAIENDVILAIQVNGHPLSPEHGYPLRLIVPGWYGMTQVKWLNRIVVLDRRYEGRHMARNYHSVRRGPNQLVLETSISRNRLKSVVARVTRDGTAYSLSGAAWGGVSPIDRVQVRIDNEPWRDTAIVEKGGEYAWSLWGYRWQDPRAGAHVVVSRAINARGEIQPERAEFVSSREDNAQWQRRITLPPR
jgi:DMSO/TMAO reductase YedYZ molybdopterin-dependent catalytic subunit